MLTAYETPGVYYERSDAASGIGAVRMDVAGFVGIAERGPVGRPVPIESWRQFQAWFGGPQGYAFLAYAVRGFFENGGDRCWVVRVAPGVPDLARASAAIEAAVETGDPGWRLEAYSPGTWGNDLRVTLRRTHRHQTAVTRFSPRAAWVRETGGFERASLVRITQDQPPGPPAWHYRVLATVDAGAGRLEWAAEVPGAELRYDEPVQGLAADRPGVVESVEYDLIVWYDGRPVASFTNLSAVPEHLRYGPRQLEQPLPGVEDPGGSRLPIAPPFVRIVELRPGYGPPAGRVAVRAGQILVDAEQQLTGGADLLSQLTPDDFIGQEPRHGGPRPHPGSGVEGLLAVEEVSLVSVPDLHTRPRAPARRDPLPPCPTDPCDDAVAPTPRPAARPRVAELPPLLHPDQVQRVQSHLVRRCEERGDVVALLEPPAEICLDPAAPADAVQAWRSRFESSHAALYYPWLQALDPAPGAAGESRAIPPTGHVAGQLAMVTRNLGPHQAAANRPLAWAYAPTVPVDPVRHGLLNSLGVNVVRALEGRGVRVLGARTLTSDLSLRFLPVRRLVQTIRKALLLGTQWAVFEPNNRFTRDKLRLVIFHYLLSLYEQGMFAGATPETSFTVRCDESNNPAAQRDRGILLAEVRVAPVTPLEFVVLRVLNVAGELETVESIERGAAVR